MTIRIAAGISLFAVLAASGMGAALADQPDNGARSEGISSSSSSISDVVDARFAVFYNRNTGIVREKNVVGVFHPYTGSYCIKLRKSVGGETIDAQKLIPNVTVDWETSAGSDLLAFFRSGSGSCPKAKRFIEVRTFRFGSGTSAPSDDVSSTVTIP